jgi:hypothetical protein
MVVLTRGWSVGSIFFMSTSGQNTRDGWAWRAEQMPIDLHTLLERARAERCSWKLPFDVARRVA